MQILKVIQRIDIIFPGYDSEIVTSIQTTFNVRHSDAAKRITSCTTCDNKSRQKSFKPTLDIKIKGGITHTHIEY